MRASRRGTPGAAAVSRRETVTNPLAFAQDVPPAAVGERIEAPPTCYATSSSFYDEAQRSGGLSSIAERTLAVHDGHGSVYDLVGENQYDTSADKDEEATEPDFFTSDSDTTESNGYTRPRWLPSFAERAADMERMQTMGLLDKYLAAHHESAVLDVNVGPFILFFSETGLEMIWIVVFGALGAAVSYWLPALVTDGMAMGNFILNIVGAFVIAIATSFQQVKFQYRQTYIVYSAVKNGFCSSFTTFGNLIEDTEIYTFDSGRGYLGFLYLFMTLSCAFVTYEMGRRAATWWKRAARDARTTRVLESDTHRMAHELEKSLLDAHDTPENMETPILHKAHKQETGLTARDAFRRMRSHRSVRVAGDEWSVDVASLEKTLSREREKKKRHATFSFQRWHIGALAGSVAFVFFVGICATFTLRWQVAPLPQHFVLYSYWVSVLLSVLGVVVGGRTGDVRVSKNDIQWGTVRVNMASCLYIAVAHNILLFRRNFPYGSDPRFSIFFNAFISNFCGSASSFAGLIDDTAVLWNSRRNRHLALKEVWFNVVLCMALYIFCVYAIRFAVIYGYAGS